MPRYVLDRLVDSLSRQRRKAINGARILLVGMAYKADVDDTRESPALRLWELLAENGAAVDYHDPYVEALPRTRKYPHLAGKRGIALTEAVLAGMDAAVICTAHKAVDHGLLVAHCPLVIDTRNATAPFQPAAHVVKA
jgi:UDP-N-acetyl-D-glucosamine dehydrogenase